MATNNGNLSKERNITRCEIVIVGSGAAGCCAAIGAYRNGASKILMLEKSKRLIGGTTKIAGGGWVWFPNNPFLKEKARIRRPVEDVVKLMRSWTFKSSDRVDAYDEERMRDFASESEAVIETLIENKYYVCKPVEVRTPDARRKVRELLIQRAKSAPDGCARAGVDVSDPDQMKILADWMPSYCCDDKNDTVPVGSVLQPTGLRGGTSKQLIKAARECGCEIRMGASCDSLVVEESEDGKKTVRGVRVTYANGDVGYVYASKGVIFASGGFGSDTDLVDRIFGSGVVRGTCAAPTNCGDFLRIARRDLDIPTSQLDRAWVKQVVLPFDRRRGGVFFLNVDSGFMVARDGARFLNEKHHYQERATFMLNNLESHRLVFFVYDERSKGLYNGPLRGVGGPIPLESTADVSARGESVAELAVSLRALLKRVDPSGFDLSGDFESGLERTLQRFNRFAKSGVDEDFGRGERANGVGWHLTGRAEDNTYPNQTMHPLRPPYYAVVLGISLLDTKSGPKIDGKCRVLDRRGRPVENLYGAGNCVRSSSQKSYWSAGCTISHAMTFGYVAGRECARHKTPPKYLRGRL